MLRTWAVAALTASTSRKSSAPVPGTGRRCQVRPPSVVRSTVPSAPLAHATSDDTALTPRSRTVTPLDCGSHVNGDVWAIGPAVATASTTTASAATAGREAGNIGVIPRRVGGAAVAARRVTTERRIGGAGAREVSRPRDVRPRRRKWQRVVRPGTRRALSHAGAAVGSRDWSSPADLSARRRQRVDTGYFRGFSRLSQAVRSPRQLTALPGIDALRSRSYSGCVRVPRVHCVRHRVTAFGSRKRGHECVDALQR